MSRLLFALAMGLLVAAFVSPAALADKPVQTDATGRVIASESTTCTKIQAGVLTYSAGHFLEGQPLKVGFDAYGYNYQGHMFDGFYANSYLGKDGFPPYTGDAAAYVVANPTVVTKWYWPYRDVRLMMKWNDAWLSNVDCDGDGLLDRHYRFTSYIGSGAWETNRMKGTNDDGSVWVDFVKIIAVPASAVLKPEWIPPYLPPDYDGTWYAADGTKIGPAIWGAFAIIQEVYNDPAAGAHGILYLSPDHAGFGGW